MDFKSKIRSSLILSAYGIVTGPLIAVLVFGFSIEIILRGVTGGFFISLFIALAENFFLTIYLRRYSFTRGFILRSAVYSIIILLVILPSRIVTGSGDFTEDLIRILAFSIIVGFLITFFIQINFMIGKRILWNYLTGKYHTPKEEERIFMFLDLAASTSIAEKYGSKIYYELINDYFYDINDPILSSSGEIYQYVGDEVVITWEKEPGFNNADCIECFFKIKKKIDIAAEEYKKNFGVVPEFKAGLHSGKVIAGEIGDSKKEIVYHGDVINTASHIQEKCKKLGRTFLISGEILKNVKLPAKYKVENMGKFKLKTKENEVELFSVEEAG